MHPFLGVSPLRLHRYLRQPRGSGSFEWLAARRIGIRWWFSRCATPDQREGSHGHRTADHELSYPATPGRSVRNTRGLCRQCGHGISVSGPSETAWHGRAVASIGPAASNRAGQGGPAKATGPPCRARCAGREWHRAPAAPSHRVRGADSAARRDSPHARRGSGLSISGSARSDRTGLPRP